LTLCPENIMKSLLWYLGQSVIALSFLWTFGAVKAGLFVRHAQVFASRVVIAPDLLGLGDTIVRLDDDYRLPNPGRHTLIWGYNGTFPGPTIQARRGRTVVVRHVNQLVTPTVVHLHGGVPPPESDGFPMDHVMPGDSREYVYPNAQRAATLWYHDHAMDRTAETSTWASRHSTCSRT
jgi:hypothetical protein